jgi:hypothetical protein
MLDLSQRHPTTRHYLEQLGDYDHLPPPLKEIARAAHTFGAMMAEGLHDGIELSTALKHVRDAKDAFVRQRVADLKS